MGEVLRLVMESILSISSTEYSFCNTAADFQMPDLHLSPRRSPGLDEVELMSPEIMQMVTVLKLENFSNQDIVEK